jgi:hypothetical protein
MARHGRLHARKQPGNDRPATAAGPAATTTAATAAKSQTGKRREHRRHVFLSASPGLQGTRPATKTIGVAKNDPR